MRFDKKEANTKTRRSSAKSSRRKASRGVGGITNTVSRDVTSVTESDYCDMRQSVTMAQAGEDMASLISFGSLPSSSGGSGEPGLGQPRDLDPDLATLLRSGLSDEEILQVILYPV